LGISLRPAQRCTGSVADTGPRSRPGGCEVSRLALTLRRPGGMSCTRVWW
jgi:hypothetical protein